VFLRDRAAGTTIPLSRAPDGTQAGNDSSGASVSADGRYVAFQSGAANLVPGDTNGVTDVFVYDVAAATLARVSVAGDESAGDGPSQDPDISGDGRYVAFLSGASNLVGGDTNGKSDVFVRDRVTGTTTRVSVATDGTQSNGDARNPSISDDGDVVAFDGGMSNLVGGDTNDASDVFVRDRNAGTTSPASVSSDGVRSAASADDSSVSADGGHVVFMSRGTHLDGPNGNEIIHVYVRDLTTGETTRMSRTPGAAAEVSLDPAISGDGRHVAFSTRSENLVPEGGDRQPDVFVVDRTPPAGAEPRFVMSELRVDQAVVPRGGKVTVSARVTNGSPRPGGTTAGDGTATAEAQEADHDHTLVVTRPASGREPYGYLLVRRLHLDEDTSVALSPTVHGHGGDPAAMLDLRLDRTGKDHRAWTTCVTRRSTRSGSPSNRARWWRRRVPTSCGTCTRSRVSSGTRGPSPTPCGPTSASGRPTCGGSAGAHRRQ
jgi:hypothetical protein